MRPLTLILLLFPSLLQAQISVFFIDHQTTDAVAFASVINSAGKYIGSADVDGKFMVKPEYVGTLLTVKSIGYKNQTFTPQTDKQCIYLHPDAKELSAVDIYPTENPAHRIIRNAINNRDDNNPEKCCRFTYESYNKLVFFAHIDSANYKQPDPKDTGLVKFLDFNNKSYFFITESVTEKKHIPPDQDHEKVIAARVSGFSNPMFAVLSTELQSFSFYNDYVQLMGERYVSPLCPGSINKYLFLISDTLIEGSDSTYIITFTPRKNKSFRGMRGEIHISTRGFAIAGVKAEPAAASEQFNIKIQQMHTQVNGATWFPHQLNARIAMHTIKVNEYELTGEATGYLRNIQLHAPVRNRDIQEVELEMPPKNAEHEKLLQQYRVDSLNAKEKYTYNFIDSVSKKENLEKKMNVITTLASGRIPLGPVDINLAHLLRYNNYEGLRLGLGLITSRKLVNWMHVGGYGAYGFKDKEFKYGGDIGFHIWPQKDLHVEGAYQLDLVEAASPILFRTQAGILSPSGIRELYLNNYDMCENVEVRVRSRFLKHFFIQTFARTSERQPRYAYTYTTIPDDNVWVENTHFSLFETGMKLRFCFREKFFYANQTLISKGSKFPALSFEYIRAWSGILNGGWDLDKMKFGLDYTLNLRHLGRLLFNATYTQTGNDVPYFYLIHPASTYAQIGISAPQTFETMRPYEFVVNRGYAFHITHQFLSALFSRAQKKGPQLELCASAFYGTLTTAPVHTGITMVAPNDWYTEAGFRLNRLLKSNFSTLGIGVFYRLGPNAFGNVKQDIALRITSGFSAD